MEVGVLFDDLEEDAAHTAIGGFGQGRGDGRDIAQEIRHEDGACMGQHAARFRHRIICAVIGGKDLCQTLDLNLAPAGRKGASGQANALSGADQKHRHRQRQKTGTVGLFRRTGRAGKPHRCRLVDPELYALRDLPFLLADILGIGTAGAAPVDHAPGIARLHWPVLPEIVAQPGPAAAVFAQKDGPGKVFGPGQKRREMRRLGFGPGAQRGGGRCHAAAS